MHQVSLLFNDRIIFPHMVLLCVVYHILWAYSVAFTHSLDDNYQTKSFENATPHTLDLE